MTVTVSKQPAVRNAVSSGDVTLYGRLAHTTGAQTGKALQDQLRQVEREHVAKDELHVFIACKRSRPDRAQALVELDGDDLPGTLRELLGQAADAGADLEHAGARVRAGGIGNVGRDPRGGEKVLPRDLEKRKSVPARAVRGCPQDSSDSYTGPHFSSFSNA